MEKYISFDSWWGGLNNIRQSYELAAAISYITKRTLILPNKIYIDHISDHSNKKSFINIWNIFDEKLFKDNFSCIDYIDVDEYQKYNSSTQYFENIVNNIKCIPEDIKYNIWGPQGDLFNYVFTTSNITDEFKNNRQVVNLNIEDKFIHFPRNLFGHFYHMINFNSFEEYDIFKNKLKNGFVVKKEIELLAKALFNKDYNSVHIRYGDFIDIRKNSTDIISNNLLNIFKNNFEKNKDVYIATDEQDTSKFNFLKKDYNILFLSDLIKEDIPPYLEAILEIVICSNSNIFLGSKYSTYTDYINILRHYKNKKNFSKKGLNYDYTNLDNNIKNYSWDRLFVEMY